MSCIATDVSVLRYTPVVPSEVLRPAGGMTAKGHVELMSHQLRAIRAALALAYSLGRMLVLPPIWCGYDKYWAPLSEAGVIPGAHSWVLPIGNCPLDHLFNPSELKPSPAAYVREHSFLDNPKLPSSHRRGVVRTSIDLDGGDREWRRLKELATAPVLDVTNLYTSASEMWKRQAVLQPRHWKLFRKRFANFQGGWCCAPRRDKLNGGPHAAGFHLLNTM